MLRNQPYKKPIIKLNFNSCPKEKLREAFECALTMREQKFRKQAD